jgi:hypothetical protein
MSIVPSLCAQTASAGVRYTIAWSGHIEKRLGEENGGLNGEMKCQVGVQQTPVRLFGDKIVSET